MQIVHPVGVVMDLQVALADPTDCEFPGIIGLHIYPIEIELGGATSGYMISLQLAIFDGITTLKLLETVYTAFSLTS